jgi:hypothetical protein
MRNELSTWLSKRYKMTHLSEDMNINYAKLYRFMKGENVGSELYDAFFKLYLRRWNS